MQLQPVIHNVDLNTAVCTWGLSCTAMSSPCVHTYLLYQVSTKLTFSNVACTQFIQSQGLGLAGTQSHASNHVPLRVKACEAHFKPSAGNHCIDAGVRYRSQHLSGMAAGPCLHLSCLVTARLHAAGTLQEYPMRCFHGERSLCDRHWHLACLDCR